MFIVFVALGLPFPQVHLSGGGGGGGNRPIGVQFKKQTQTVDFPQVLLVIITSLFFMLARWLSIQNVAFDIHY